PLGDGAAGLDGRREAEEGGEEARGQQRDRPAVHPAAEQPAERPRRDAAGEGGREQQGDHWPAPSARGIVRSRLSRVNLGPAVSSAYGESHTFHATASPPSGKTMKGKLGLGL